MKVWESLFSLKRKLIVKEDQILEYQKTDKRYKIIRKMTNEVMTWKHKNRHETL